jgi:DNA transposition AAA+ family ATPase
VGRHFLGVEGASTIPTEHLLLTRRAVADLVEARAMGAVHGDAGLGKTFAVEEGVTALSYPVCWASFPSRPTMRLVATVLVEMVTGVPATGYNRFQLTGMLVELLGQCERLIVIDEAQRLNRECIEYLRHLHDHPQTVFGLALVGGDGCWQVLSREPMLRSRIYRRVVFRPLSTTDVVAVIHAYHPIYAEVDDALVVFIDDYFGHGNLRNWASFTRSAASLCRRHRRPVVDEEIARNVFALHGGGVDAR